MEIRRKTLSPSGQSTIMPLCHGFQATCTDRMERVNKVLRSVDHVLSAAKKESQTQSVLALSQVPQASSHPPEALPNLPSSAEEIVKCRPLPTPAAATIERPYHSCRKWCSGRRAKRQ